MTVQKSTSKSMYIGDGTTTVFPITFEVGKTDYIHVYVREDSSKNIIETKNFRIDNNSIVYPNEGTALPLGGSIVISREMTFKQEMNLVNQGPFFAEDIEQEFDDVVMMLQQLKEVSDRSLLLAMDSTADPVQIAEDVVNAKQEIEQNTQKAIASASAALQSEQNAALSESASLQNKIATDENRTSVEQSKAQVDGLLSDVIAHEEVVLGYMNASAASAGVARASEESARGDAITANNSATLAVTKASEAKSDADTAKDNAALSVAKASEAASSQTAAAESANMAYRWAQAADSPDGGIDNKSSKTWAGIAEINAFEAARQADYCTAMAATTGPYNSAKTYNPGETCMTVDGKMYRCIMQSVGENPPESGKWVMVTTVISDTFEEDGNGDLMPMLYPKSTSQFDIDTQGDIMPAM